MYFILWQIFIFQSGAELSLVFVIVQVAFPLRMSSTVFLNIHIPGSILSYVSRHAIINLIIQYVRLFIILFLYPQNALGEKHKVVHL